MIWVYHCKIRYGSLNDKNIDWKIYTCKWSLLMDKPLPSMTSGGKMGYNFLSRGYQERRLTKVVRDSFTGKIHWNFDKKEEPDVWYIWIILLIEVFIDIWHVGAGSTFHEILNENVKSWLKCSLSVLCLNKRVGSEHKISLVKKVIDSQFIADILQR